MIEIKRFLFPLRILKTVHKINKMRI
jgi:hypothetical protein